MTPSTVFKFTSDEKLTVNIGSNNTKEYRKIPNIFNYEGKHYVKQGYSTVTGDVYFILATLAS